MSIRNFSSEELEAELKRRQEEEAELDRQLRLSRVALAIRHRSVLEDFMEHDRMSCSNTDNSGYHPEHGGADCSLCALRDLESWQDDVEITVEVRLRRVS